MTYKPLNDNVIIEKLESAEVSAGGIVLTSVIESEQARVLAIADSITELVVGDTVVLNWSRAQKIGKNEYRLSVNEILAVVE